MCAVFSAATAVTGTVINRIGGCCLDGSLAGGLVGWLVGWLTTGNVGRAAWLIKKKSSSLPLAVQCICCYGIHCSVNSYSRFKIIN